MAKEERIMEKQEGWEKEFGGHGNFADLNSHLDTTRKTLCSNCEGENIKPVG